MDPIQRTKGRFKAFDSDDDAGQWKTILWHDFGMTLA